MHFVEKFAVARVKAASVNFSGITEGERQVLKEHRWWTLEELRLSDEIIYPPRLALLLEPILKGEIPEEARVIEL